MTMLSLRPDGALDSVGSSVPGFERSAGRTCYRAALLIGSLIFLSLLQGCAAPERLAAVPKDQEAAVETVSGMADIRYWEDNDADVERLWQDRVVAHRRETELLAAAGHKGPLPPAYFLAISLYPGPTTFLSTAWQPWQLYLAASCSALAASTAATLENENPTARTAEQTNRVFFISCSTFG